LCGDSGRGDQGAYHRQGLCHNRQLFLKFEYQSATSSYEASDREAKHAVGMRWGKAHTEEVMQRITHQLPSHFVEV
jgi:hypothetical protein